MINTMAISTRIRRKNDSENSRSRRSHIRHRRGIASQSLFVGANNVVVSVVSPCAIVF